MAGKTTGGYLSGQKGATVNRPAYAYGGSNPSPPTRAVGQLAARLAHIQEVTGSSPVCATRPMQDGRRSAPPIPEPVWRKSRRTGLAGPGPFGASGFVSRGGRRPYAGGPGGHAGIPLRLLGGMADTPASGAGVLKDVRVQVPEEARGRCSAATAAKSIGYRALTGAPPGSSVKNNPLPPEGARGSIIGVRKQKAPSQRRYPRDTPGDLRPSGETADAPA